MALATYLYIKFQAHDYFLNSKFLNYKIIFLLYAFSAKIEEGAENVENLN